MLEVEAKIQVADLAPVRGQLLALGAERMGEAVQDDTFFAHPCRDLAAADETLRLRRVEGAGSAGAGPSLELTYKGPARGGAAKVRHEEGVRVERDPAALLAALGFRPQVRLRKRRESWRLGPATVELDEIVGLGCFVEVEVMADDAVAAAAEVEQVVGRLGLAGAPRIATPYVRLALEAGASGATRL